MEHEDTYHVLAPYKPQRLKVKVTRSRRPSLWYLSANMLRTKSPIKTKIGKEVAHPRAITLTGFEIKRLQVNVTTLINAKSESVSPIRTSNFDGGWSMQQCHYQQQRSMNFGYYTWTGAHRVGRIQRLHNLLVSVSWIPIMMKRLLETILLDINLLLKQIH